MTVSVRGLPLQLFPITQSPVRVAPPNNNIWYGHFLTRSCLFYASMKPRLYKRQAWPSRSLLNLRSHFRSLLSTSLTYQQQ